MSRRDWPIWPDGRSLRAPRAMAIGATHRTAPLTLRERIVPEDGAVQPLLADLTRAGLTQALAVATCDRVEVFAVAEDAAATTRQVTAVFAAHADAHATTLEPHVRTLVDADAVRHLAAVAAGLDSLVLGEPEVFGQVKAAEGHARAAGLMGPELDRWIQAAFRIAKRVRAETAIGQRPVGLASAALGVASRVHGDLAARSALVIGAGDAPEMIARTLIEGGLGRVTVSHPTERRAQGLAQRLRANLTPFSALDAALATADIVLAALGDGRVVLTRAGLEAARRARRRRPMVVFDLALPSDLEPTAETLDDIFVFRLDNLERIAEGGRAEREGAAAAAWALIDQGVADYMRAGEERQAVPAIVGLRRAFEAERDRLLAEQPGLDGAAATRVLIQRVVHGPTIALRRMAGAGDDVAAAEALLARLFAPDTDTGNEDR